MTTKKWVASNRKDPCAEYFPVSLSSAFLASCLSGEETISTDFLLTSFLGHITADERELFDKVVSGGFEKDDKEDGCRIGTPGTHPATL